MMKLSASVSVTTDNVSNVQTLKELHLPCSRGKYPARGGGSPSQRPAPGHLKTGGY